MTAFTDGQKVVPATTFYQGQSGGLVGSFQAQYTSPEGAVSEIAVRVLLSSEGDIQSTTFVDVTSGSGAGIELAPGGRVTPYVLAPSSGGFAQELSSQSIAVSEALEVVHARLPTDTPFEMILMVGDAADNIGYTVAQERVR